jgi:hypothetical protein
MPDDGTPVASSLDTDADAAADVPDTSVLFPSRTSADTLGDSDFEIESDSVFTGAGSGVVLPTLGRNRLLSALKVPRRHRNSRYLMFSFLLFEVQLVSMGI